MILKCGCAANCSLLVDGKPVPACFTHGVTEPAEEQPDLTDRWAKCPQCGNIIGSSEDLAFFEHHPDNKFDIYYCGCKGWD